MNIVILKASGVTLKQRTPAEIPTPPVGRSTMFLDLETGRVSVMDSLRVVTEPAGIAIETIEAPEPLGILAAGTSPKASAADHVHAHGNLPGGTLHTSAVADGVAGFLTGADKAKLDSLVSGGVSAVTAAAPLVSSGGTTPDISMPEAGSAVAGYVSAGTQTIGGAKTFTGAITASNLSGTNTGNVTLGTPNGLGLASQVLSLAAATTSTPGALSAADKLKLDSVTSGAAIGSGDSRLSDSRIPTGSAGGSLTGTYPSPTVAALSVTAAMIANATVTDTQIASLNKDGLASVPSLRTIGTGALQSAAGNDSRLSDARVPSGSAGGSLTGTYPSPTIANSAITDVHIASANKDGLAGVASLRTLGTGATQATAGNDSRLFDSRAPNGSAGGSLAGSYPSPTIAALAITDSMVAAANKDGLATIPSLRTIGTGALQATAGNDGRLSDSRTPSGSAGGSLTGTYPNPTIAAVAVTASMIALATITDAQVATANKDGLAAVPSLRTLGSGATQAASGTDARLSDARAPNGSAGGSLTGTYPNPTIASQAVGTSMLALLAVTDAQIATANKDGLAATPSLRTLGAGVAQAAAGNDSRLSDARVPTGSAGGSLTGTYPNPTIASGVVTAAMIATGTITDSQIAAANKDGLAGVASLRTLGAGATQAASGTDTRLSDSRAPNGSAGGSLTGTYPNPTIAALVITDAMVATANKDGLAATPSLRTLGVGAAQAVSGTDARLSDARTPSGSAGGSLTGTYPNPTIASGVITAVMHVAGTLTDTQIATANKDGLAAVPSLRTLGSGATQAAGGTDARLSDSRVPSGSAGGSLTGTYPSPTIAALAITDAMVAVANKDGLAGVASLRTLGIGATQAVSGTDGRLSDARVPSGSAGGSLTGTYPNPTVAALAITGAMIANATITDTQVAAANKDGLAAVPSLRTLGVGALQSAAGNDSRLSDARIPSGSAGGSLTGTYPSPTIAALAVTDTMVAAANKDGLAGVPSLRTLGVGATQAAGGTDSRLSDSRAPNGSAGGSLTGTYPNPTVAALAITDNMVATANKDGLAAVPSLRTLGVGATQAASGTDARLSDARVPSGLAGGSLTGTYPNPVIASGIITAVMHIAGTLTDVQMAVANKDGLAAVPSLRTLGAGATQAAGGTDARLSDSRAPNGTAGGSLTGSYPNPTIAALAITDAMVAVGNKDGLAAVASLRTLGVGATQAVSGTDARLSDSRAPNGSAGGSLTGTYPNPTIASGVITAVMHVAGTLTDTQIAAANKDGLAAVPSLRTLGVGATQAVSGTDARLSDARAPNGAAAGDLGGTYPSPTVTAIHETSGPTKLTFGAIAANRRLVRGSSGDIISSQTWQDQTFGIEMFDDFMGGTTSGTLGWVVALTGAAAAVGWDPALSIANHPGVAQWTTGTTATGHAAQALNPQGILLGGGIVILEMLIQIPILSVVADEYVIRLGLHDERANPNTDPADGVWFQYGRLLTGANWQAQSASNSTKTTAATTVPVAINSWIKLRMIINVAGTSVAYYINDMVTPAATIATNIPVGIGRQTGVLMKIDKTAGLNARTFSADYFYYNQAFTTPR